MRSEKTDKSCGLTCAERSLRLLVSRRTLPVARMLAVVMICATAGCTQLSRPEQVAQAEKADADGFLHDHLEQAAVVTVGETCRAMLMLADGEERFTTHELREAELVRRGILRSAWNLQRDDAIDQGSVAYMVMQILKIRGGVNAQVFGRAGLGDRRYALRELVYMDLMPRSPTYRYVTGGELVDLIGRADEYMANRGMYAHSKVDIEEMVEHQKQATATAPAR